jgi:pyruvate carboxylase subunit B
MIFLLLTSLRITSRPRLWQKALKKEEPVTCRPADLLPPEMDKLTAELGDKAKSVEDVLSYALFPAVALQFFAEREAGKFEPEDKLPKD